MSARRLVYALVINAAIAASVSHTGFAQMVALGRSSWVSDPCAVAACPQSNLTVAFVPVGSGFLLGESFTNRGAFADGCPACKENSRPFIIPPGILMRMSDGVSSRGFGDEFASDENGGSAHGDASAGEEGGGGSGSQALSSGTATAGTGAAVGTGTSVVYTSSLAATVTVNPEPATLILIATGMFGLVPIIRHRRSR